MPEPKKRKLTLKQQRFVKEYIDHEGNATQAVRDAYPNITTPNAQSVMGSRLISNDNVQLHIRDSLAAKGFTIDTLNDHLLQIINSDDLNVKNKGLRLACEIIGAMSKQSVTVNTGVVSLDIDKIRQALTV